MDELQRQLRIALIAISIVVPLGIFGFMIIEGKSFLNSTYFTVITLATIGYGDELPVTPAGRIFTMFLVIIGLSAFAFALQVSFTFIASPAIRVARQRRSTQRKIDQLSHHYIICGMGETVDKTVEYLLQGANAKNDAIRQAQLEPIEKIVNRLLGDAESTNFAWLRDAIFRLAHLGFNLLKRQSTILDTVVVITQDEAYANHLRNADLLVIEGDPSNGSILLSAGLKRAQAMMVLLNSDMETLLTVLTGHNLAPTLHITAAVLEDALSQKMARIGASVIITPYDAAGRFLNSATLRPAVSHFFNDLLFEHDTNYQIAQMDMFDDSPWIGKSLKSLKLRERYDSGIIGLRLDDARYNYAPDDAHILKEDEILILACPAEQIETIRAESRGGKAFASRLNLWQAIPFKQKPISSEKTYSLNEAESAIEPMSKHFIICGSDRVARSAIATLNPERPFVVISNNNGFTSELLKRGFRVVHGNPTDEAILLKAGVKRAQAIMVSLEDRADSVLTVLNCRTLNKRLLITATANTDDMVDKLERAGADRVVSPFHVAARFILLATTTPDLAQFVNYVQFNYITGLETTEIYMEDDALWIGKTIRELQLKERYEAGVIGVRLEDKETFIYAPEPDYVIRKQEVLIIVTPMKHSDDLRDDAHGGNVRAPSTLRNRVLQSTKWTPDQIQKLLQQASRKDDSQKD